jgi:2-hydroxycyclohexanecarboxyl-CoA dehydrogenase
MKVSGSRVLVTGAGSGIGRATALRCSSLGASEVLCVDIDADAAIAVAEECAGSASAWTCDVADSAMVQALADEVGPVDVLVNNAGVGIGGSFLDASVEDWDWLIGINLNGVAYGCHAFGPAMVARGSGHVVNIASGSAYLPSKDMAAYSASKAAVVQFSKCLRADWHRTGVGVTAICPGVIATPIAAASRFVGAMADAQDRTVRAMSYGHKPEIVARAVTRAVEKNQAVVPVGLESVVAYRLMPFLPSPVTEALTRAPIRV